MQQPRFLVRGLAVLLVVACLPAAAQGADQPELSAVTVTRVPAAAQGGALLALLAGAVPVPFWRGGAPARHTGADLSRVASASSVRFRRTSASHATQRQASATGDPGASAGKANVVRSRRLQLGVALSAGAAALAWWSQQRADSRYQCYLHAAGTRRQERALSRAEDYDRLAGAAFLSMQAGLVLTTCVLLF